jgi:hypothetical protein
MSTSAGESLATEAPGPALPHWPDRLIGLSTVAAWLSMALIVIGLVIGLVPVRNPGVQDCGAPLAFVLTARVDVFADPARPPKGLTRAQAEAANRNRCQERVAGRMIPAGSILLGGLLIGLSGVAMLLVGRGARRRALLQTYGPFIPAPPPPGID